MFLKKNLDLDEKQKRMCVEKGSAFYNRSMKSWLQDNDIEMHSALLIAVAEKFIRTL